MSTDFQSKLSYAFGGKTKVLAELKQVFLRPLIQVAVKAINQEHIEEGVLDRISQKYDIPEQNIDEYCAAIFTIIKTHLGLQSENVKPTQFKQALDELKVPAECIEDLSTILYGQKRPELINGLIRRTRFYSNLISCKWRIDIIISSSMLNKVLEPTVIMEWIFDNGEKQIFELSFVKFHQLRHAVANILVEMQGLQEQCVLKNIQWS